MDEWTTDRKTTRRTFLKAIGATSLIALAAPVLSACSQQPAAAPTTAPAPAPTTAPAAAPTNTTAPVVEATATTAPAPAPTDTPAPAAPTATTAPVAATPTTSTASTKLKEVPRNQTLMCLPLTSQSSGGQLSTYDQWNLYPPGANHQDGGMILYEPLAFYSAFADKEIMWLAESYAYNKDYTELTIKTRPGITWSDGQPFSAADVAYTFNTLKELGPAVKFGVQVQQILDSASTPDENTVVCKFKAPAPRFFFQATYKYDLGIYIVPKHIFEKQDWTTYKANDLEKGEPVTTSPWRLVDYSPQQKVFDLREEDYWAAKQGLVPRKPLVQREVISLGGGTLQTAEQALIADQVDYFAPGIPMDAQAMIQANPKLYTHTWQDPNYGYIDWWPISLYLNCSVPPFDKKEVRWAVSRYIDRQTLIKVGYGGFTSLSQWNMPPYPGLMPYFENNQDLFKEYDTNEYNPAKADAALTALGWKKGSDGIWLDDQGKRAEWTIPGYDWWGVLGPALCQILTNHGLDVKWSQPPDAMDRFTKGDYAMALYGHGGGIKDPYDTLYLYASSSLAVPGWHASNFTKWANKDYDKIVDQVYVTGMDETDKLQQLFRKALQIWLPEMPDIPLIQSYHIIVENESRWKNWPRAPKGDPTGIKPGPQNYCNEASWHLTWGLILQNLEPAQ